MNHQSAIAKKFSISNQEVGELLKAWLAISFAFGVVLGGFDFSLSFLFRLFAAAITVGVGFLLHELGHKVVAQRYGIRAEFHAFNRMLLLAIAMSFFGVVFAAPGAVMILGRTTKEQYGKISVIGPIINLVLAVCFLPLIFLLTMPALKQIASYGFTINAWLGLFNLIPVWEFDGRKIYAWNKLVYACVLCAALGLMIVSFLL